MNSGVKSRGRRRASHGPSENVPRVQRGFTSKKKMKTKTKKKRKTKKKKEKKGNTFGYSRSLRRAWPCPVVPYSQWWSRWVWCRRVCASHYRERLPVSVFLYLYPRLNSYGTSNTQANFPSAGRNCARREYETAKCFGTLAIRYSLIPGRPRLISSMTPAIVFPGSANLIPYQLSRSLAESVDSSSYHVQPRGEEFSIEFEKP